MASGTRYTNVDGRTDRYSYLTSGNRDTRDGFVVLRGAAAFKALAGWLAGAPERQRAVQRTRRWWPASSSA
jgi:hypothetical protein